MTTAHQLFTNNADSTLNGTIVIGATTFNVAAGQGQKFPTPSAGTYFLVSLYEKNIAGVEINPEIVKVTNVTGDTLTCIRDFEGIVQASGGSAGGREYPSAPAINPSQIVYVQLRHTAYAAGNNLTKDGNLEGINDPVTARSNIGAEQAIAAGSAAQFWRGDKAWVDFATTVRSSILTGLSLVTGSAIVAADSVLVAFGKLQKQISDLAAANTGTNTGDQTSVSGNAGTATKLQAARTIDGVAFDGSANITLIAPATHAATAKTALVAADELNMWDSVSGLLRKITWANVLATLFGTANLWLKQQRPYYTNTDTVAGGATFIYDAATKGQVCLITASGAGAVTWGAPANIVEGSPYTFIVKEGDSTVRAYGYNAAFKNTSSMPASSTGVNGAQSTWNFIGGATNTLIYNGGTVGA